MIDILHSLRSELSTETFDEICIKMWGIWKDRCDATHRHDEKYFLYSKDPKEHWAVTYLEEFRKAQEKVKIFPDSLTKIYSPRPNQGDPHAFTLYVDAAYKDFSSEYALGFAIKDPQDKVWVMK